MEIERQELYELPYRRARKTLRSIKDDNGHMVNGETSIKAAFLISKTSWDRSDLAM